MAYGGSRWVMAIHGAAVQMECTVPALEVPLDILLDDYCIDAFPQKSSPITGIIHPYQQDEVFPTLSSSARHIGQLSDQTDLYEDAGRYWIVDDRWGMTGIDPQLNQWRSWILPQPTIDPLRLAELSVLWPMAELLRLRGLHLAPAISVVRDGFAVLIICPFGIEPELTAMIDSNYRIIGQRWTALREEDGRVALLRMPGRVERTLAPRLRFGADEQDGWIDVTNGYPGSSQSHAFCDAVVVVEPGRRHKAHLREKTPEQAADLLRLQWPVAESNLTRQPAAIAAALAESCRCYELQLSRNSKDLLALLNSMRFATARLHQRSVAA
jgi:hypothetical protein